MSDRKDEDRTTATADVNYSLADSQNASEAFMSDKKDEAPIAHTAAQNGNSFVSDVLDTKHLESYEKKGRYAIGTVIDFMKDSDECWKVGRILSVWRGCYWVKTIVSNPEWPEWPTCLSIDNVRTRVHEGSELPTV